MRTLPPARVKRRAVGPFLAGMWIEIEQAAALLPPWVWYVAGCAHGALLALYLPDAVAWAVRKITPIR